jgi:hypothetical protein
MNGKQVALLVAGLLLALTAAAMIGVVLAALGLL